MNSVFTPTLPSQCRTALAANSGPLSDRMCSGGPCSTNRSVRHCSTSSDRSRRATTMARQRRVNSSITHSMRNVRPSSVRSCTTRSAAKGGEAYSYDHTWLGRSGRSRTHEPSLSHRRPRFGCFFGTFSPSRRQIRHTRLTFTRQPSLTSSQRIRR